MECDSNVGCVTEHSAECTAETAAHFESRRSAERNRTVALATGRGWRGWARVGRQTWHWRQAARGQTTYADRLPSLAKGEGTARCVAYGGRASHNRDGRAQIEPKSRRAILIINIRHIIRNVARFLRNSWYSFCAYVIPDTGTLLNDTDSLLRACQGQQFPENENKQTSLRCRWQTGATQWLRPTVLYTDVDCQCDKLVTKTVTSLSRWPSNYDDSTWDDQTFLRYGWCPPKFKWFSWPDHVPYRDGLPSISWQLLRSTYAPNLKSLSPPTTKI